MDLRLSERGRRLLTYSISLLLFLVIGVHANGLAIAQVRYVTLGIYTFAGVVWLLLYARTRLPLRIPLLTTPLAIFIVYQFMLITESPVPFHGFEFALLSVFFLLLFVFFIDSLERGWEIETWENALITTAVLFSLVDVFAILNWLAEWARINGVLFPLPPFGFRTGGSFLAHPNFMAMYINLSLPLILTRVIRSRNFLKVVAWGSLIAFFAVMEYFASSRGGWLSALAGLVVMFVLLNVKHFVGSASLGEKLRRVFTTKVLIRLAGALALGFVIVTVLFRQVQSTPGHSGATSGRFTIWARAFNVFLDSPVWGNGPYSMRVLYAVEAGLPPGFSAGNAHNAILQIAGEYGVIGLALTGWLAFLLVRCFIRAWTTAPESSHPRLAGYAAAFTALTAHHMLDYAFEPELLPITAAVLLLIALLSQNAPVSEKRELAPKIVIAVIVGLLLVFSLGTAFSLKGSTEFQDGVNAANNGTWHLAEELVCGAHEGSPYISHYAFQCALIQAQNAYLEQDEARLTAAITTYKAGLERDPYWPIHWANLAALEWETGDREAALTHMQRAAEAAPRNVDLALNLGWMFEQLGEESKASSQFALALSLNPRLEISDFFHNTLLRVNSVGEIQHTVDDSSAGSLYWAGWRALNKNDLSGARAYLEKALALDLNDTGIYTLLARIDRELADLEGAEHNIELALYLYPDSPTARLEAGRIAMEMEDEDGAIEHFTRAFEGLRSMNLSRDFIGVFYMRPLLNFDLVPQLISSPINRSELADFNVLAELLARSGAVGDSQSVREWLRMQEEEAAR